MASTDRKLGDFFQTSWRDAFRLELLPEYYIEAERPFFSSFKEGGARPVVPPHKDWLDFLDKCKDSGKAVRRCRLVPEPQSEYFSFELDWGYRSSVEHGEDIRLIRMAQAVPLLQELPAAKDFWLFDRRTLFMMDYDFLGRFGGAQEKHQTDEDYAMVAERLFAEAVTLEEFLRSGRE